MANKSDFSNTEWSMIKDSPYWVQTAITAAEGRMGLIEKRREAKALQEFLDNYKPSNELVKAVVSEAKDGKHDVDPDASLEEVGAKLEDIADAVEAKTSNREFDAFNDFLLDVGNAIAGAQSENMLNQKEMVSDEEAEALELVATALRATDSDKAKRAAAAAAEQRKAVEARQKAAAESAAKEEAQRKLKEAQKKLEEMEAEQKRKEELAKKQAKAREERRKRLAEARQKAREQAAKARAEQKAADEAAAAAQETYVVQPGDTLSHIALEKLGSANAWRKIYEANKDKIKNPSLIYPGQEFVIPSD